MKEAIDRMLATEKEARGIVADAEHQADHIMAASREKAARLEESTRHSAQEEATRLLTDAERQAHHEHDEQLTEARAKASAMTDSVASRDEAVELVARTLLSHETSPDASRQ